MHWIEAMGGPLILLEDEKLSNWGGIDHSCDANFTSDYDHACSLDDYVNLISFDNFQVLVLGDEPDQTTFLQLSNKEGLVVRWRWAQDESEVKNCLLRLGDTNFKDSETLEFSLN